MFFFLKKPGDGGQEEACQVHRPPCFRVCVCVSISPESLSVSFMKVALHALFASGGSRGSTSGHISTDRSNRWRQTSGSSGPTVNAPEVSELISWQRETVHAAAGGAAAHGYVMKSVTET